MSETNDPCMERHYARVVGSSNLTVCYNCGKEIRIKKAYLDWNVLGKATCRKCFFKNKEGNVFARIPKIPFKMVKKN